MTDAKPMVVYTIYDHPRDFPHNFVCRQYQVLPGQAEPTGEFWVAPSLEMVRALIPVGMTRIERDPKDDPVIVESWI